MGEGEQKLLTNCLVIGLVGLLVLLTFGFSKPSSAPKEAKPRTEVQAVAPDAQDSERLERELAEILSAIAGAGEVKAAITLEGSVKREYAENNKETLKVTKQDDGKRTVEESVTETQKLLAKRDGLREEAVLEREIFPAVKGALVVAEGAGDPAVAEKLIQAAAIFLGVGSNRIMVMEGK